MMSATGSTAPLRPLRAHQRRRRAVTREATPNPSRVPDAPADPESISSSSSSSAASEADLSVAGCPTPFPLDCRELASALASVVSAAGNDSTELAATPTDKPSSPADLSPLEQHKQLIIATMKRHRCDEEAHQSPLADRQADDSPIGQLTYRLFAPCQLVNSSSCFAINPVNSSSPLARRGSVDLNGTSAGGNSGGSAGRLSSDNAHPSTLLLGPGNEQPASQHVVTSFGAFFPALSQDLLITDNLNDTNYAANHNHQLLGSNHNNHQSVNLTSSSSSTASNSKFTTNEFEPVDAIKRRMEIYVTTNSMKVVAGETLIVNLSDALSCLSTAIEQTLTKAPQLLGKYQAKPSTWVSVYVLYATVHETQLPDQLLAQQRLRYEQQLSLISEEPTTTTTEDQQQQQREQLADAMADALFDDQFRSTPNVRTGRSLVQNDTVTKQLSSEPTLSCAISSPPAASLSTTSNSQTLDHIVPSEPSLTIYNSAYDRTVALPTQPE